MLTVALTCGMYDYAGEWAYSVGIPAKSGVGGGILGILPGVGGIAVFSPRLDDHGNSVRGLRVFEELVAGVRHAPLRPRSALAPHDLTGGHLRRVATRSPTRRATVGRSV